MAVTSTEIMALTKAQVLLYSTTFDDVGDSMNTVITNDTALVLANFTRRFFVLDGSFTVTFGGTEPSEFCGVGCIWPTRTRYALIDSTFTITANVPGSTYYTIVPRFVGDQLNVRTTSLVAGKSYTIQPKTLAFVLGTSYSVNIVPKSTSGVYACETNPAKIVATQACTVIEFTTG